MILTYYKLLNPSVSPFSKGRGCGEESLFQRERERRIIMVLSPPLEKEG